MVRAPGFSHPQVPRILRVAFGFTLALGLSGAAPRTVSSASAFGFAIATEFALGAAVGFGASVLYEGVAAGAAGLDDYIGVRGQNPGIVDVGGAGLGPAWNLLIVASYFLLGGYIPVLTVFASGFRALPPGALVSDADLFTLAHSLLVFVLEAALLVAAPAIVLALTTHVTIAAVARVVPRLASMQISWPLAYGIVIFASVAAMPLLAPLAGSPWIVAPMLHHPR